MFGGNRLQRFTCLPESRTNLVVTSSSTEQSCRLSKIKSCFLTKRNTSWSSPCIQCAPYSTKLPSAGNQKPGNQKKFKDDYNYNSEKLLQLQNFMVWRNSPNFSLNTRPPVLPCASRMRTLLKPYSCKRDAAAKPAGTNNDNRSWRHGSPGGTSQSEFASKILECQHYASLRSTGNETQNW